MFQTKVSSFFWEKKIDIGDVFRPSNNVTTMENIIYFKIFK